MCKRVGKKAPSVSAVLALLAVSLAVSARAQPHSGPTAVVAIAAQPSATDFQLSPKNGQDDVQQWFDRYECDSWARRESGYDPINEHARSSQQAARDEYLYAMAACLTEHGYEVRYVAPESPPPASAIPYIWPSTPPRVRELRYRAVTLQAGGGYSVAAGSTADYIRDGANAGAALNWFPSAALPLGVRVEGSYTWFKPGSQLLALNGVGYNNGEQDLYGGDIDLRLNLSRLPSRQQLYLAAGVGWYRIDTTLQKVSGERVCGTHFCGVFQTLLAEEQDTSPWESSWNAGVGWEAALDSHTAFFIEARYRHIHRYGGAMQLVPIWLGLRF
jgi:opacity protein-like surface antigen